jgi:dTDP-4-amino-4,6-dideoxygalactose transaminase
MKIPLVDLKAQYSALKSDVDEAIREVIERSEYILGSKVKAFEEDMASYLGAKYAIGVASGTDALQLALLACGIKPGDSVITTPFTFIATAEAITWCGATPVFVDIDPATYNIDPQKLKQCLEKNSHKSPVTAILPVHLYGQPADMEPILELAQKHNLKIIEDCAQSLGAKYKGKRVGTLGDAGCLSFFPSKVLGAYGDGGMVVTGNHEIAEKVTMLRNHGCHQKYYHLIPGFNSRLDELQAAILMVKLVHLDGWITRRIEKASLYSELISKIEGIEPACAAPYSYHVFNYYTIRVKGSRERRDSLRQYLASEGIATAIYYPLSLHLQDVYKNLGYKPGDFPASEKAQDEVLSLPIYPELEEEQIKSVAKSLKAFI